MPSVENLISNDLPGLGQAYGEKYNGSWPALLGYYGIFLPASTTIMPNVYLLELNRDVMTVPPNSLKTIGSYSSRPFRQPGEFSNEAFFEPAKKIVDELKLRASYGSLGNQSVGGGLSLYSHNG